MTAHWCNQPEPVRLLEELVREGRVHRCLSDTVVEESAVGLDNFHWPTLKDGRSAPGVLTQSHSDKAWQEWNP